MHCLAKRPKKNKNTFDSIVICYFCLGCFTGQCGLFQKCDPNPQCWTSPFMEKKIKKKILKFSVKFFYHIFFGYQRSTSNLESDCKNLRCLVNPNLKFIYRYYYNTTSHLTWKCVISEKLATWQG
jgi:hypothetical protein